MTGKVTVSGPEVKKVITKSSSDRVKASSAPAIRPGFMKGTSTFVKVCHSIAPEIARCFFQLVIEADQARTHDDRHKGKAEGDVGDDDGGEVQGPRRG